LFVTTWSADLVADVTNKMYLILSRLGATDMVADNTIAAQYYSGSGTNQIVFRGLLAAAAAGYIGWSNTMVNFNGTAAALDNDDHDIRSLRMNATDSSATDANDRIVLNSTSGASTNAGDSVMLEQIDITLEGVDSETDVRSETKTGDEEVVEVLLENGAQTTGADKIALNATDGSATDANDNVVMEAYRSNIACYTQTGSSTGTGLVFNGVTTT
jgi:hypothetical protein